MKPTWSLVAAAVLWACCLPTFAAAPAVTQLWVGTELHQFGGGAYGGDGSGTHIGMPGANLGLRYEGRGPLPEPVEFVIPLEKKLPLGGVYRLYVKNFYVGRMEATIGDITKPLRMVRFDWTVGEAFEPNAVADRIVLRYFPSNIVQDTGAPQDQNYIIQGVFLTTEVNKIPVGAGEIVELLPQEQPPGREGNYVRNGSFEVGLTGWGKRFQGSYVYSARDLDEKAPAADGAVSIKLAARGGRSAGVETPMMRLPGDQEYTLKFWAKADGPVRLRAGVDGISDDLKNYSGTDLATVVEPAAEWAPYVFTGKLAARPGFLYTLGFEATTGGAPAATPDGGAPVTVWLDAVELVHGKTSEAGAAKFRPRGAAEVGWVSAVPGNIFYDDRAAGPPAVELLVDRAAGGDTRPVPVTYRTFDFWGRQVDQGEVKVPVEGRRGATRLPVFAERRGIFRTQFAAGDSESEMVYSVLPPNPNLNRPAPAGTLGADASFDPFHLTILKRANFNWVLSKTLGRWNNVEPERGTMLFRDAELAEAEKAGVSVAGQILKTYTQPWLEPHIPQPGGAVWETEHRRAFMEAWERYVSRLVGHYKGRVTHWEIENEPNAGYPPEAYGEMLKRASRAIRKVDPGIKIVAFSGGGFEPEFYEQGIAVAGADAFDAFSVHLYGNDPAPYRAFAALCSKYGKPGWNTETGSTNPTFFTALPEFEAFRRTGYRDEVLRAGRGHAATDVRNYLTSLSHGRMSRYLYYFARFGNASPSQPTRWGGNGKEIAEYDGSLRANGVCLSVASHFMDGATYHGTAEVDERLEAHVFKKGTGSVGFLLAKSTGVAFDVGPAEGGGFVLSDVMGNPVAGAAVRVSDQPAYFTFDGPVEQAADRLKGLAVKPAPQP